MPKPSQPHGLMFATDDEGVGAAGDAMNALLVATGHNLRLILNRLRLFVAWLMAALMGSSAQSEPSDEPWNPIAA